MSEPIRAVTTHDTAAVLNLARATGLFPAHELAELGTMLATYLRGGTEDRWDVLTVGSRVVALTYYAPERMTNGTWNLHLLAVDPSMQGRGFGARLVRHVESDLRRAGARTLLIETSGTADFTRQREFYRRLGYVREARIREFYDVADDKIVFAKQLSAVEDVRALTPGLRPAGAADVPVLLELADAFYREDGFGTSRDDLAGHLDVLVDHDAAHVTIAEADGTAVGFGITTCSFGLENGLVAELEDLFVVAHHRREGWAGRLIEDAAAWAAERGAAHLEVVVAPNERDVDHLHAFYERRGFVDDGRRLRSRALITTCLVTAALLAAFGPP